MVRKETRRNSTLSIVKQDDPWKISKISHTCHVNVLRISGGIILMCPTHKWGDHFDRQKVGVGDLY
jgi:hypothetical protein